MMMNQDKCARHDVYFSNIMNMIPSKYYFPTDPEENWKQNKYHKNIKASAPKQLIKDASKKAKKAKFNPPSQQTNLELQEATASSKHNQNMEVDEPQPVETLLAKPPTQNIEALRQRLTERISTLREKRKADEALEKQKRAKKGKKKVHSTKSSSSMKPNQSSQGRRLHIYIQICTKLCVSYDSHVYIHICTKSYYSDIHNIVLIYS